MKALQFSFPGILFCFSIFLNSAKCNNNNLENFLHLYEEYIEYTDEYNENDDIHEHEDKEIKGINKFNRGEDSRNGPASQNDASSGSETNTLLSTLHNYSELKWYQVGQPINEFSHSNLENPDESDVNSETIDDDTSQNENNRESDVIMETTDQSIDEDEYDETTSQRSNIENTGEHFMEKTGESDDVNQSKLNNAASLQNQNNGERDFNLLTTDKSTDEDEYDGTTSQSSNIENHSNTDVERSFESNGQIQFALNGAATYQNKNDGEIYANMEITSKNKSEDEIMTTSQVNNIENPDDVETTAKSDDADQFKLNHTARYQTETDGESGVNIETTDKSTDENKYDETTSESSNKGNPGADKDQSGFKNLVTSQTESYANIETTDKSADEDEYGETSSQNNETRDDLKRTEEIDVTLQISEIKYNESEFVRSSMSDSDVKTNYTESSSAEVADYNDIESEHAPLFAGENMFGGGSNCSNNDDNYTADNNDLPNFQNNGNETSGLDDDGLNNEYKYEDENVSASQNDDEDDFDVKTTDESVVADEYQNNLKTTLKSKKTENGDKVVLDEKTTDEIESETETNDEIGILKSSMSEANTEPNNKGDGEDKYNISSATTSENNSENDANVEMTEKNSYEGDYKLNEGTLQSRQTETDRTDKNIYEDEYEVNNETIFDGNKNENNDEIQGILQSSETRNKNLSEQVNNVNDKSDFPNAGAGGINDNREGKTIDYSASYDSKKYYTDGESGIQDLILSFLKYFKKTRADWYNKWKFPW